MGDEVKRTIKAGDKESIMKSLALKRMYKGGWYCTGDKLPLTWFVSSVKERGGVTIVRCKGVLS